MSVHHCSNPRTEIWIRWIIRCRGINLEVIQIKLHASPGKHLESFLVTILSTIQQANSNGRFLKSNFVHQLFNIVGAIPLKELPKCKPWGRIHFTRSLCNRSLRLLKLKRREYERAGTTRTRHAGCIVLLLRGRDIPELVLPQFCPLTLWPRLEQIEPKRPSCSLLHLE